MRGDVFSGVAALALLAGCAQQSTQPVVTLANAQAEASAIMTALEAGATIYTSASTTTPAEVQAVENLLAPAQAAVSAFEADQENETQTELAETVSEDVEAVLAVLPIDPATKTAIDAGMAVIDALVAGLSVIPVAPVASSASARLGVLAAGAPPVAIPTPHVLPPTISSSKA